MSARRVTIDGARLWRRHEQMGRIGATAGGGVNRQALAEPDLESRTLLLDWAAGRGYRAQVDGVGNLFVSRPGHRADLAPVLTGSHLDTQPAGGRYDGAYGVLAGFEVLATLDDCNIATERTVTLVCWMNEEGSRFAPTTMGSGVFAGAIAQDCVLSTRDVAGITVSEALATMRARLPTFVGTVPTPFPIAAYVELHIEQGPVLERQGKRIGAVTGIQGLRWFEVTVHGRTAHAGTTPHASRQDALMAALALIAELRQLAENLGGEQVRFTVGRMTVAPGSPNTVPDQVIFTIDLRHPDGDVLVAISRSIEDACRTPRNGCTLAVSALLTSQPVAFEPRIVESVRLAAADRGYPCLDLVSGATHDAKHLSSLCPTGMIFIPCLGGVSHHEAESITPEDATAGAQVLADVILELASAPD